MKIAVCDDDQDELHHISSLLENYIRSRSLPIVYTAFQSATELLATAKSAAYDLYLLDVLMPAVSGMEAAKEIRSFDKMAKIAFLTNSPEFAIESYTVKACNYLLKPITQEKLYGALDDILESCPVEKEAVVLVKSREGIEKIRLSQLTYVEALGRSVLYYLASGKVVECIASFSEVCSHLLTYEQFVQPHRSYLVNMSYINTLKKTEIVLQTNGSIPMAQRRTAEIKARYLAFQMEG